MALTRLKPFLRDYLLGVAAIAAWYLFENRHHRGFWFAAVALVLAAAVLAFVFLRKPLKTERITLPLLVGPNWIWPGTVLKAIVLIVLFYTLPWQVFGSSSGRFLLAYLFAGAGAVFLASRDEGRSLYTQFMLVMLLLGGLYKLASYLPSIQSTPFSLGWSEGSRYYNASTFFARQVYGRSLPLPVLHPSRYLMQALPFAFGSTSILLHRIWQVLLWLGMTALGAWALARRWGQRSQLKLGWLVLALALFFFQGAVYYHLMVCVLLVLLGYKRERPVQTLMFVLLASVWAGISRVNWIPAPALLAVSLYLLDEPLGERNWLKYLSWPMIWTVLGLAVGWGAKQVYMQLSGEPPAYFDSAFSSALLWSRLLPNATFFLGILPGILLVMLPAMILLWQAWRGGLGRRLHWLRWLGLGGILLAFFGGGILVSLKIGGGGDLHNLDGFLVFWALIAGSLLLGGYTPESAGANQAEFTYTKPGLALLLAAAVPVFFAFLSSGGWAWPDQSINRADLAELRQALQLVQDEPGDVLFISERQLLSFDELPGVSVYPDYEKVFLMEMAMGNNRAYLDKFVGHLEAKDFSAIVLDPVGIGLQNERQSFAAENNAWKKLVLYEILDSYEPVLSWQNGEVNLLVPRGRTDLIEALKAIRSAP